MEGCMCSECSRMRAHTDQIRRRLRALESPAFFFSTDAAPVVAEPEAQPVEVAEAFAFADYRH